MSICLKILFMCSMLQARTTRSGAIREAEQSPYSSEFILPVQNVKELQNGYLTIKDSQLSSVEDASDTSSLPCVPRNSPEGIARLYFIAKQLADEAEKGQMTTATNGSTVRPTTAGGGELPPVVDEITRPPFNDTSPFDGIDVSEVMELRIVKPLCKS
ncbi:hypothetical protein KIN20_000642 [Parelaphostrongylus tenuis]|uniref:Uncharacterized protein n=1 Tax=Parelaphostrongylus tenuis TaxID=148309 RepID=A0AAD5QBZ3_PARTN|nr:hypothetical protein KIN20_000642 [Parelaphostrongylus tenuis]